MKYTNRKQKISATVSEEFLFTVTNSMKLGPGVTIVIKDLVNNGEYVFCINYLCIRPSKMATCGVNDLCGLIGSIASPDMMSVGGGGM